MKKILPLFIALIAIGLSSHAQYEHRFSATLSGSVISPFSTVDAFDLSDYPGAIGNFDASYGISAGFHLNPGKRLIFAINANYINLNSWSYDYELYSEIHNYNNKLSGSNLGLGIAPRLYFNPRAKRARVYMQFEVSINYLNLTLDDLGGTHDVLSSTYALGFSPAFGLDISITEPLGIFLNGALGINYYNESQFTNKYFHNTYGEQDIHLTKDNLNFLRIELGVRYSFLKSKKI